MQNKVIQYFSIRSKLLLSFSLVVGIFILVSLYFLNGVVIFQRSLTQLSVSSRELNKLFLLERKKEELSNSIKSFVLTSDSEWEEIYNSGSLELDLILDDIELNSRIEENKIKIAQVRELNNALVGTELLVLAKVREGAEHEARVLFDKNYNNQQELVLNTISHLVETEVEIVNTLQAQGRNFADRLKDTLLVLIVLCSVIGISISFILSSLIANPIKKLSQVAQQIAGGNLDKKAVVVSNDEVGQLAQIFNDMTTQLNKTFGDLEEKNKYLEKTQQNLKIKVRELEQFNKLNVGRELKMIELKKEIKALKASK